MKISGKRTGFIVGLIIVALAGLIIIQTLFISSTFDYKEQIFNRNVLNALKSVAETIETQDAVFVAIQVASDFRDTTQLIRDIDSLNSEVVIMSNDTIPMRKLQINKSLTLDNNIISGIDSLCEIDSNSNMIITYHLYDTTEHIYSDTDNGQVNYQIQMSTDSVRVDFIERVINRMWRSDMGPIENRLDSTALDSLLAYNLEQAGIDIDFVMGVKTEESDDIIFADNKDRADLIASPYRTELFPFDPFSIKNELIVYFPDRQTFLWKQVGPMLGLTTLFIIIIALSFYYTIRTIFSQRKTTRMMVDFINNMTHEFKTPISTIRLACEAIDRPDVISDGTKVRRYSDMIRDENERMRRQAEKILQMAALEEGDFELKLEELDIHNIIKEAARNIALQVESKGGSIMYNLNAEKYILVGDRVHLTNIIFNLLDNANKYSPEAPRLKIYTVNEVANVAITIEDNGIGMSEENVKMVFNKYFRVPSGNIHDVKGFGLGLSYVKLMTDAHGGKISMTSKPGEGTRIKLTLPLGQSVN